MKKHNATLVILTFNEINGVKALYGKLPFDQFREYFVIDPGSTDGTLDFWKKKKVPIVMQEVRGRGEAFRIGCAKAKYKNVVFFSPDGNEDPKDIVHLIEYLEKGYDMAIASRFMKISRADDSDDFIPLRGLGNKTFTFIANVLWGGKLTDSINGFRAIRKSKFKELNPDAHGFCIEYQMSVRAMKLKYKIKEIPTNEGDRIGGKSTAHTFRTGMLLGILIIKELIKGKTFQKSTIQKHKQKKKLV